jgi:hypothetical protein
MADEAMDVPPAAPREFGAPDAVSDNAVLTQGRDGVSVEPEPIGEHFGGMLAE